MEMRSEQRKGTRHVTRNLENRRAIGPSFDSKPRQSMLNYFLPIVVSGDTRVELGLKTLQPRVKLLIGRGFYYNGSQVLERRTKYPSEKQCV
jgi:hypothetical protein